MNAESYRFRESMQSKKGATKGKNGKQPK